MCSILNCHRKNKLSYPDDATHLAKWKKVTGPFTDVYGCSKNFGICPIHFPSQKPKDKGSLPSIWLDYKFPERRTYLQSTFNKLQGSSDEVYLKISEKCPDENLLDYVSLVEKPLKKGQKVIPCYVVPDPTTSELMLLIKSKITRDESRRMTNRTFLVKGKNKNTLITKKSILKLEQMREKQRIEQGEKRLVKMRLGFLNVVRQCRVCRGNKIKVLVNIPENKTLHSMVKASFGIDVTNEDPFPKFICEQCLDKVSKYCLNRNQKIVIRSVGCNFEHEMFIEQQALETPGADNSCFAPDPLSIPDVIIKEEIRILKS